MATLKQKMIKRRSQARSRARDKGVPRASEYRHTLTNEEKAAYSQMLRAGGVSRSSSGGSA